MQAAYLDRGGQTLQHATPVPGIQQAIAEDDVCQGLEPVATPLSLWPQGTRLHSPLVPASLARCRVIPASNHSAICFMRWLECSNVA